MGFAAKQTASSALIAALASAMLTLAGTNGSAADIASEITDDNRVMISVGGEIEYGDDIVFREHISRASQAIVVLEGPGGNLSAALEIGRLVRMRRALTAVQPGRTCASACALAWLGGAQRAASSTALIGFHAAYEMQGYRARESGAANAVVGAYMRDLGLPLSAITFVTSAEPSSMTWLPLREAYRLGIDVHILEAEERAKTPAASSHAKGASLALSPGSRWIVLSSHEEYEAAVAAVQRATGLPAEPFIIQSSNGYYGVIMGPFSREDDPTILEDLKAQGRIAGDAYYSNGQRFRVVE